MNREEKAKVRFIELCNYIAENHKLPNYKSELYNFYGNVKNCFAGNNTMKKYGFYAEIANEYNILEWFTGEVKSIIARDEIKNVQDFINTNLRLPHHIEEKELYSAYIRNKESINTEKVQISVNEMKGHRRLNKIISELLTMNKPMISKLSRKNFSILMDFKMTKSGNKKGLFYRSYDKICEDNGFKGLLDLKKNNEEVNEDDCVKIVKRYTVFYLETVTIGSHSSSFSRMKRVATYDIKKWLDKNNITADYVLKGFHTVSKDWSGE